MNRTCNRKSVLGPYDQAFFMQRLLHAGSDLPLFLDTWKRFSQDSGYKKI